MKTQIHTLIALALLLSLPCRASIFDDDFDRDDHEEPAGSGFTLLLGPADGVYGFAFGQATRLKGTPITGDYFILGLSNEIEDAAYSGVGMTFRLMPSWTWSPFIGAGGGYNLSLSETGEESEDPDTVPHRGESYWAAHVEAGIRLTRSRGPYTLYEILLRYTRHPRDRDRDYTVIGITIGAAPPTNAR